jgi:hypothetical protein
MCICHELVTRLLQPFLLSLARSRLILQSHTVLNARETLTRHDPRTITHDLFQWLIGHERVDEATVQSLSGSLKALKSHCALSFGTLQGNNAGLRYAHPLCELSGGHAQALPNRPNPAKRRLGRELGHGAQLGKALI